MPHYLLQGSYSSQAWAKLTKNPEDRTEPVRKVIQGLGGKLVALFLAFGEYDVVALIEMPDNVSAAAFSIAGAAGGAVKNVKTTPLMTIEDGIAAMRKAAEAGYRPPA